MPKTASQRKRIIYFIVFVLFFVFCIPILIFYSMGYSIDLTNGFYGRGGIYVSVAKPDIDVYIGNELKRTTSLFQREVLVKNLKPKEYLVLTGNDAFWPWAKIVPVLQGEVSALYPLLIPRSLPVKEIFRTNEIYKDLQNLFFTKPKSLAGTLAGASTETDDGLVEKQGLVTIANKNIKVWKDDNLIFASWLGPEDRTPPYFCPTKPCSKTLKVFTAYSPIGQIDFYPRRDDVIMLTLDRSIYAMEIDNRTYHNFYPLFKGEDPDFRVDKEVVYIKDSNRFYSIDLE